MWLETIPIPNHVNARIVPQYLILLLIAQTLKLVGLPSLPVLCRREATRSSGNATSQAKEVRLPPPPEL